MSAAKEPVAVKDAEESVHAALDFDEDKLLHMYEMMLLSRRLDERMWILQRQGQAPFHISCQGHEACGVGAAQALDREKDILHPYYRDMSLVLAMGMTPRELMLSLFAKKDDPSSAGRQMPAHYGKKQARIIAGSSPVATQIPQAVGVAYASMLRGEDAVTLTSFGEGASSKGDFHEGLNFAGIHKCPVVFLCENNVYAISVPQSKQMAIEDVATRAQGYGFPGVVVDGTDVFEVYKGVKEAVDRARRGDGPTLIEAKTYRIVPHSSDDADRRYRDQKEVEEWREKQDPLKRFREYLEDKGVLGEAKAEQIEDEVMAQVNDATDYAADAPDAAPEDALRHVYAE